MVKTHRQRHVFLLSNTFNQLLILLLFVSNPAAEVWFEEVRTRDCLGTTWPHGSDEQFGIMLGTVPCSGFRTPFVAVVHNCWMKLVWQVQQWHVSNTQSHSGHPQQPLNNVPESHDQLPRTAMSASHILAQMLFASQDFLHRSRFFRIQHTTCDVRQTLYTTKKIRVAPLVLPWFFWDVARLHILSKLHSARWKTGRHTQVQQDSAVQGPNNSKNHPEDLAKCHQMFTHFEFMTFWTENLGS